MNIHSVTSGADRCDNVPTSKIKIYMQRKSTRESDDPLCQFQESNHGILDTQIPISRTSRFEEKQKSSERQHGPSRHPWPRVRDLRKPEKVQVTGKHPSARVTPHGTLWNIIPSITPEGKNDISERKETIPSITPAGKNDISETRKQNSCSARR